MSWGDIDDDGDADLAVMGRNRSGEARTLVYVNEAGELRPNLGAGVTPLRNGDLAWGDYDNDGDLDLVVTGQDGFGTPHSELFATDVLGGEVSFERAGAFPDLSLSSADWGDADSDGDLDLVLMGLGSDIDGATRSHTQLWLNDGEGGFAEAQKDLVGLHDGEAAWADADGDGDSDLAVTGTSSAGTPELRLYLNDGSGPGMVMLSLTGLESSDLAWGDWDRDGDPDLLAAGTGDGGMAATLWENDGGSFTEVAGAGLPGIRDGDLAWGDYDNDQDLDVVIAGNDGSQAILQIWENTIGRTGAGGAVRAGRPGGAPGCSTQRRGFRRYRGRRRPRPGLRRPRRHRLSPERHQREPHRPVQPQLPPAQPIRARGGRRLRRGCPELAGLRG